MSQLPSFGNGYIAPSQRLVREKDNPQLSLLCHPNVEPDLIDKRTVGYGIIERKRFFQMRSR